MTSHNFLIVKTVITLAVFYTGVFFFARAMRKRDHQMMMDFKNENWDE